MAYFLASDQRSYIDSIAIRGRKIGSNDAEKDKIIAAISRMPRLERLYLEETDLNDDDCQTLSRIKTLKRVAVCYTKITDDGVSEFANLPELLILDAHGTRAGWRAHLQFQLKESPANLITGFTGWTYRVETDKELADLSKLKKPALHHLTFKAGQVSLESVIACSSVKSLRINSSQRLTDEELKRLFALERMEEIQLIDSFDNELEDPQARSDAKWKYANRVARLLADRVRTLDLRLHSYNDSLMMSFGLWRNVRTTLVVRVVTDGSPSVWENFTSFTELPTAVKVRVSSDRPLCTPMFSCMPKLKSVTIEGVDELPPKMVSDIAQLEDLRRFELNFTYSPERKDVIPNDFFRNWKSQDRLTNIRVSGLDEFNFESRKPLEEFPRLKVIQVLRLGAENYEFR